MGANLYNSLVNIGPDYTNKSRRRKRRVKRSPQEITLDTELAEVIRKFKHLSPAEMIDGIIFAAFITSAFMGLDGIAVLRASRKALCLAGLRSIGEQIHANIQVALWADD